MQRRLFRVYVDEAGDRGWGPRSSEVFVLAAVVVPDEEDAALRVVLNGINEALGRSLTAELHWADNLKRHDQRKFVAKTLAETTATFVSVVVHKESLRDSTTGLTDQVRQYLYPLRLLLERISWCVDELDGEAKVTFAHVRRFPYERLDQYLDLLWSMETEIRWGAIRGANVHIDRPGNLRLLQMADLVAGAVFAAFHRDKYGSTEPSYLLQLAPRLYTRPSGVVTSYGLKVIGSAGLAGYPWVEELVRACGLGGDGPGRQLPH
jgi:hypothetical protein